MISILISSQSRYPINRDKVRVCLETAITASGLVKVEVSVVFVGLRKMKLLSRKYMGDNLDHEVLSFPLEDPSIRTAFAQSPDGVLRLGDIVICYPEVIRIAKENNQLVDDVINSLLLHSFEHLLGHHHE